jgi:hypothetical protein
VTKNHLLGLIVNIVADGITGSFSHVERGKVSNYGQIINANCHQRWKLFVLKSLCAAGG